MRFITLFLILSTSACVSSAPPEAEENTSEQTKSHDRPSNLEPMYCNDIAEVEDLKDTSVFTTTHITDYELVEGCVCISFEYSGCREGDIMLAWSGEWQESQRPEVMMRLLARNAGLCDQVLTDSACFSLKEMQLVGNEVLVYLNTEQNDLLLNYNEQ